MRMRLRLVARLLGDKLFNTATNPKLIYSLIDSSCLVWRERLKIGIRFTAL